MADARLTPAQRAAVAHVTAVARAASPAARERLDRTALAPVAVGKARVALHFHPDRLVAGRLTVAGALLRDGRYLSQFVTRISNGGLTAHPGGDRRRWERAMFGGAYDAPGVRPADRPVYGALDLWRYADGPAPRFGSCHLRLRPEVLARTTFSVGDSVTEPVDVGTAAAPLPVVAGLSEEVVAGRTRHGWPTDEPGPATDELGRVMDDYVEAQVHGPVRLADDVDLLVADPSFAGTAAGDELAELCRRYDVRLAWHPGYVLGVDEVPSEPRGPLMPVLARRLAARTGSDTVTAAVIGAGARHVVRDPTAWAD